MVNVTLTIQMSIVWLLIVLCDVEGENKLTKMVDISDRFGSGLMEEEMMLKGTGKEEIEDGDCDHKGCKLSFDIPTDMMIKEGWGKIINIKNSEGMKGEIKLAITKMDYFVELEYMYSAVRGMQYARWGSDWSGYDGDIYEYMCDMDNYDSFVNSFGQSFEKYKGLSVANINYCKKWQLSSWSWGWLVGLKEYKCTGYGYDSLNFGVASIMAYDYKRIASTFHVIKTPTYSGILTIAYDDETYQVDITSEMEESRTIQVNENVKIEIGTVDDRSVGDIPAFLIFDQHCDIKKIGDTDFTCKISSVYEANAVPDVGVIPSNGFGRYQVVRVGSNNLLFDDREVKNQDGLSALRDIRNTKIILNIDGEDSGEDQNYEMGINQFNNELLMTKGKMEEEKRKIVINPFPPRDNNNGTLPDDVELVEPVAVDISKSKDVENVTMGGGKRNMSKPIKRELSRVKRTVLENKMGRTLKGNNEKCRLSFTTTTGSFMDNILSGFYNATEKMAYKEPIMPSKMEFKNGMPMFNRLGFKNLAKINLASRVVGTGVMVSYSTTKGLVTELQQRKCVIYSNAAGSYISFKATYTGPGGTLKLTSKDLHLAATTIFVEKTGVVTDIIGIKGVITMTSTPGFCVEDVCIGLEPEFIGPREGSTDNDNYNDFDGKDEGVYFMQFMNYTWSGIITSILNVIIIIADICFGMVSIAVSMRTIAKLMTKFAWLSVVLLTFGKIQPSWGYMNFATGDFVESKDRSIISRREPSLPVSTPIPTGNLFVGIREFKEKYNWVETLVKKYEVDNVVDIGEVYGIFKEKHALAYVNITELFKDNEKRKNTKTSVVLNRVIFNGDNLQTGYTCSGNSNCYLRSMSATANGTKYLEDLMTGSENDGETQIFVGSPEKLKAFMGDDGFDGTILMARKKVSSQSREVRYVVLNRIDKNENPINPVSYLEITEAKRWSAASMRLSVYIIKSMADMQNEKGKSSDVVNTMLEKRFKISGDYDMKTSCSKRVESDKMPGINYESCMTMVTCYSLCKIERMEEESNLAGKRSKLTAKGETVEIQSLSDEGRKEWIKVMEKKIDDEIVNLRMNEVKKPKELMLSEIKDIKKEKVTIGKLILNTKRVRERSGRDPSVYTLSMKMERTDEVHEVLSEIKGMIRKGRNSAVLSMVDTVDTTMMSNGFKYISKKGGPIMTNCLGHKEESDAVICNNEEVIVTIPSGDVDESETKKTNFRLASNATLHYTVAENVGFTPNDHDCHGEVFVNYDSVASCSDDCCLLSEDDWKSFMLIDPTKTVKLGDKKAMRMKQYVGSEDTEKVMMLQKPKGCAKCKFACMVDCMMNEWPVSFWAWYLSPLIIIGIGILMGAITALLGIKLNLVPKKLSRRIRAHGKDYWQNVKTGNLKIWQGGKNVSRFNEMYKGSDDIEKGIVEKRGKLVSNMKNNKVGNKLLDYMKRSGSQRKDD